MRVLLRGAIEATACVFVCCCVSLVLQSVYIFSRQGRGRCAVVGGCVLGRLYGIPGPQVLDYLSGSCSGRKYFIKVPPRAQPLFPAIGVKQVETLPAGSDASTVMTAKEDAKRDWKRGVVDRRECRVSSFVLLFCALSVVVVVS